MPQDSANSVPDEINDILGGMQEPDSGYADPSGKIVEASTAVAEPPAAPAPAVEPGEPAPDDFGNTPAPLTPAAPEPNQQTSHSDYNAHGLLSPEQIHRPVDFNFEEGIFGDEANSSTTQPTTPAADAQPAAPKPAAQPVVGEVIEPPATNTPQTSRTAPAVFPAHLLAAAGITSEQAQQQFGNPQALATSLEFVSRQMGIVSPQEPAPQQVPAPVPAPQPVAQPVAPVAPQAPVVAPQAPVVAQPVAPVAPVVQQAPAPAPAPVEEAAPEDFLFEIPATDQYGNEWDPDSMALMNGLNQHYGSRLKAQADELKAMRAELSLATERDRQERVNRYMDEFSGAIKELGDEWAPVLGDGNFESVDPNSPVGQNIAALDRAMMQHDKTLREAGMRTPPLKQLAAMLLPVQFPNHHNAILRGEAVNQVSQRDGMTLTRTGSRLGGGGLNDRQRAAADVDAWRAENITG